MARFNRKKFFDGFRDRIDSSIEQEQVDGLNYLLDQMEVDPFWKDLRHIAYALATTGHETAWSFQPVEEGYYLGSTARVVNFQKTLRYYPYFGRGYVQLTWKQNYQKAGETFGVDLVDSPELALEIDISYKVLTRGMHQGWFTGKKLTDYISGSKCDYKGARKIINGTDKAAMIAGYAVQFEAILKASLMTDDDEIDDILDNLGPTISADVPAAAPFDAPANDPAVESTPTVTPAVEQPPIIPEPVVTTTVEQVTTETSTAAGGDVATTTTTTTNDAAPIGVVPAKPSLRSSVVAFATMIYGYYKMAKEDFGTLVDRATDAVDIHFVMNIALGAGLVTLGMWLYNRSGVRAAEVTKDLIATAADQGANTVQLVKREKSWWQFWK